MSTRAELTYHRKFAFLDEMNAYFISLRQFTSCVHLTELSALYF